jgi:hypothetical protein
MDAIGKLFSDNAELMLSVDEADAAAKIVSLTRIHAVQLPTPTSVDEMYLLLAKIFGELLSAGTIAIKPFGLSTIGQEDFNRLVAASR